MSNDVSIDAGKSNPPQRIELRKFRFVLLLFGAMISLFFGGFVLLLASVFLGILGALATGMIAATALFWRLLKKVPVGHVGVLQITGTRTRHFPEWLWGTTESSALDVVDEGWVTIVPFLMSLDGTVVDMRQQTINFTENEKDGRAEILCRDGRVFLKGSAQFQAINPYLFLDTRLSIILSGLPEAILSAIRDKASNMTALEVIDFGRDQLDQEIKAAIANRVTTWGVEVLSVNVTEIRLDPKLEEAQAQEAIEQREQIAEKVQVEARAEQMRVLINTGLTPPQAAIVNASITKSPIGMRESLHTFRGDGANNPLTQAAAVFQDSDRTKE